MGTRIKFKDLSEVDDEHVQPIVQLLRGGHREEAYAKFYQLCSSIRDLVHDEAMLLSSRIHEQARAVVRV